MIADRRVVWSGSGFTLALSRGHCWAAFRGRAWWIKDLTRERLLFSEREGYRRPQLHGKRFAAGTYRRAA